MPYRALQFARGASGSVLVLDVATDLPIADLRRLRVTQEFWSPNDSDPKRYMVWGEFDDELIAEIPAKELRAEVRRKGIVAQDDEYKAIVLETYLKGRIDD